MVDEPELLPELPEVPELLEPLEPPLVPELELFVDKPGCAPAGSFSELPEEEPDVLVRLISSVLVELLRLEPAGSLIERSL